MKTLKCPDCGKKMKEQIITVSFPSNPHGHIDIEAKALVCENCGSELIPEGECEKLLKMVKKIKRQNPISKEAKMILV